MTPRLLARARGGMTHPARRPFYYAESLQFKKGGTTLRRNSAAESSACRRMVGRLHEGTSFWLQRLCLEHSHPQAASSAWWAGLEGPAFVCAVCEDGAKTILQPHSWCAGEVGITLTTTATTVCPVVVSLPADKPFRSARPLTCIAPSLDSFIFWQWP